MQKGPLMEAKVQKELDAAIEEDPLIQGLLGALHRRVELIAFGISYIGTLEAVDVDLGVVVVTDDAQRAMIEIERVESMTLLAS